MKYYKILYDLHPRRMLIFGSEVKVDSTTSVHCPRCRVSSQCKQVFLPPRLHSAGWREAPSHSHIHHSCLDTQGQLDTVWRRERVNTIVFGRPKKTSETTEPVRGPARFEAKWMPNGLPLEEHHRRNDVVRWWILEQNVVDVVVSRWW